MKKSFLRETLSKLYAVSSFQNARWDFLHTPFQIHKYNQEYNK